jgi:hypothetical protein
MGHFTVPCGLSGVPIRWHDQVVGFNVVESRWERTAISFAPINIPIVGLYDDYGRMEDKDGNILRSNDNGMLVLCHKKLWDAAAVGWDDKDCTYNKDKKYVTLSQHHKNAQERVKDEEIRKILTKMIEKDARHISSYVSMFTNDPDAFGPYDSLQRLMDLCPDGILNGLWNKNTLDGTSFTKKEYEMLSQMVQVYFGIYTRGRQITPTSHCFTVQDTDYKEELRWATAVKELVEKKAKRR